MGSRLGLYEYRYRFSMVDEQEIKSLHKSYLERGRKAYIYEMRTKFILKTTGQDVADVDIDSETLDAMTYTRPCPREDVSLLYYTSWYRLNEYWMTEQEIMSFIRDAVAFARNKSAQPENANLNPIPVVVDFEVRTVQQEGEALDAAMDRAITAHKLVPLYLWPLATSVERKSMTAMFMNFLRGLERVRVDDVEQGSGLMEVCRICDRRPAVGDQISVTTWCKHAFHSHCLVRWLEGTNKCPICPDTAYGSYLILGLTFEMV